VDVIWIKRGVRVVACAGILAWMAGVNEAAACPNCKEAVSASDGEVASAADGYNWSVLFMLSVPFSLVGTGAFMVHRAVKRGQFPEM
jgi:hypothetical protein